MLVHAYNKLSLILQLRNYIKKFPAQIAKFENVKTVPTDWGIKLALQRGGVDDEHPEFHSAIMQFWIERFFPITTYTMISPLLERLNL